MMRLTVLGATGSIGDSMLDMVCCHPDKYSVLVLTVSAWTDKLMPLCHEPRLKTVVLDPAVVADALHNQLGIETTDIEIRSDSEALEEVMGHPGCDVMMAAIVGAAGPRPMPAVVHTGKCVLLVNKEVLAVPDMFFMDAIRQHGAIVFPVNSKHNTIL